MNIVDSSGWVEYLTKGANGPVFLPIIQDTKNLLVPSIAIYEVLKRVLLDMDVETALQITGVMSLGQEVVLDREIAIEAAQISADRKLAMADSIILATARIYEATLWTQDAHFRDIEGVNYVEKKQNA
jgi:toxin FitB